MSDNVKRLLKSVIDSGLTLRIFNQGEKAFTNNLNEAWEVMNNLEDCDIDFINNKTAQRLGGIYLLFLEKDNFQVCDYIDNDFTNRFLKNHNIEA